MKKIIVVVLLLVATWWFSASSIDVPNYDLSFDYEVRYAGEAGRFDALPMLIALHGNTPDHFYDTVLDQLRVPTRIILLKGPIPYGVASAWPWTPDDYKTYGAAINEAIVLLARDYETRGKPILMGFSGGGMMAYYQAYAHGEDYAFIFPVSGNLSDQVLQGVPLNIGASVHAFHGKEDAAVSFSGGERAVEILQDNGAEVQLTSFEGGHQGIFLEMKPMLTQVLEESIQELSLY